MCNGCKRFQATVFKAAVTGLLPKDRTEGSRAFKVIEADYAGRSYTLQAKFQEACTTLPIDKSVVYAVQALTTTVVPSLLPVRL